VNAIARITAAIGCTLTIDKITCCSDLGARLADHLSKGEFTTIYNAWPTDRPRLPPTILAWLDYPSEDPALGDKILKQIAAKGKLQYETIPNVLLSEQILLLHNSIK
jgi:hypothetical protein